jgi:hypothetical protein
MVKDRKTRGQTSCPEKGYGVLVSEFLHFRQHTYRIMSTFCFVYKRYLLMLFSILDMALSFYLMLFGPSPLLVCPPLTPLDFCSTCGTGCGWSWVQLVSVIIFKTRQVSPQRNIHKENSDVEKARLYHLANGRI